ncbi:ribosomal protein S11 [Capsaspora owczarzaki ATCC 30864]|uniref:Small ribosomal subunit protein uS17 n=1 Tax=Capsaspora owczarzaki (strain ATCC 30864) TaxID=595528 RepID=A0A0D2VZZ9_CAPO3|nr:ribosomal protein S11 [Capsaspora owczarzaki ATCC 30864]KJE97467.1 ribosomal protein S11 [Capsaspora owczarzaki ATCC 30864]|eukprot:XP_004343181.1 ribosomal protein S11 [Capsaspora owczarzaki ATCC 30864]
MEQTEKAFQKQPTIFGAKKRVLVQKISQREGRFWRNVGLGIKTPREAIEGNYVDKKCPFTGDVSIRGRILTGVIANNKMKRTITVRRDYLHYIKKYNRFEKRHRNLSAHISPAFKDVDVGDSVVVGQCRPLSKTVRFNVLKVIKDLKAEKAKKQFNKF